MSKITLFGKYLDYRQQPRNMSYVNAYLLIVLVAGTIVSYLLYTAFERNACESIGGHGIFCPQNFFIAFLDVSRHAELFDAMFFLGEKKISVGGPPPPPCPPLNTN